MKCGINAQCVTTFIAGFIFSIGLSLSGMTQPAKVLAFLDIAGDWDPSLAMVMFGALSVYFIGARFTLKREKPLLGGSFGLPTRVDIDGRLVSGALLFGVGWGIAGYCPGPALASMFTFEPSVMIFIVSMTLGMYIFGTLDSRFTSEPDGGAGALEVIETARMNKSVRAGS